MMCDHTLTALVECSAHIPFALPHPPQWFPYKVNTTDGVNIHEDSITAQRGRAVPATPADS